MREVSHAMVGNMDAFFRRKRTCMRNVQEPLQSQSMHRSFCEPSLYYSRVPQLARSIERDSTGKTAQDPRVVQDRQSLSHLIVWTAIFLRFGLSPTCIRINSRDHTRFTPCTARASPQPWERQKPLTSESCSYCVWLAHKSFTNCTATSHAVRPLFGSGNTSSYEIP